MLMIINVAVYSATFGNIFESLQTVKYFQNKNFVMVWTAVLENGNLCLKFTDKRKKIQCEILQTGHTGYLPHAGRLYSKKNWIFQQDSVLSHGGKLI